MHWLRAMKHKTSTITFRVSRRFKEILQSQAERHRMSVSSLARVGTVGLVTAMLRDEERPPPVAPARRYQSATAAAPSAAREGSPRSAEIIPFPRRARPSGDESA